MHMDRSSPNATPMPADSWIIAGCDGPVCVGAPYVGGCELITIRTLPQGHVGLSLEEDAHPSQRHLSYPTASRPCSVLPFEAARWILFAQ